MEKIGFGCLPEMDFRDELIGSSQVRAEVARNGTGIINNEPRETGFAGVLDSYGDLERMELKLN